MGNNISGGIIALIIAVSVGIVVGLFFLIKYVFVRTSIKKTIKELELKNSYLYGLLLGNDSQYIKRLEMISRTNLLYADTYSDFMKRFTSIHDIDAKYAEAVIKQLKSLVNSRQFKNIKSVIQEAKKAINVFETNCTQLDSELSNLIRPEEEARHTILKYKEDFRSIKNSYNHSSSDLEICSNFLENVFSKIESKFQEYEEHIDSAEYEEAKSILPVLSKVLGELKSLIEKTPKLCALINNVIPSKIKELIEKQEELEAENYPLYHLMVSHSVSQYEQFLSSMKEKVSRLEIKGIEIKCNEILDDIQKLHSNFLKEISSKDYFENNCQKVYSDVLEIEKAYVRMVSSLPEMRKIYLINEDTDRQIEDLHKYISRLGGSKRLLDTYIHSGTKQPYSILSSRLNDLIKDYTTASNSFNDFRNYLNHLKASSEDAFSMVFSYYYSTKRIEEKVRRISLPVYTEKYIRPIEDCYSLLNEIDILIKTTPIDVSLVENKVENLKLISEKLNANVDKDLSLQNLAESSIIFANRDRSHQSEVHLSLCDSEKNFFDGDFTKCYHDVVETIKNKHVDDQAGN